MLQLVVDCVRIPVFSFNFESDAEHILDIVDVVSLYSYWASHRMGPISLWHYGGMHYTDCRLVIYCLNKLSIFVNHLPTATHLDMKLRGVRTCTLSKRT